RADAALLVIDASAGVTHQDQRLAERVDAAGSAVVIVLNKWDLLDEVVARLPPDTSATAGASATTAAASADEDHIISVAIVGRPNVGKSTLFNRLIGEERSVVHDLPGTTRDTIDTVVETPDGPIRFVDTAGLRRRAKESVGAEYYSLVRALQAIDRAEAALFVIDATEGVTHQDQRLAERVDGAGNPIVICLNKWELLDATQRAQVTADIEDRLSFLSYAPVLKISALTGLGVHKLLPKLAASVEAYHRRVPTRELNKLIAEAQAAQASPGGRVLYATQGASDPPTFTLFATRTIPPTYLRYLERRIREHFEFGPTPLKLRVRRRGA
ncbi:MAG: GTPase, partial [Acidimicrobiaceae bacterium]|nr:GTPase [Acidimicrobiaceae bacterium]